MAPSDCQLCGGILDTLFLNTSRSAVQAEQFLQASLAPMGHPSPPGTSQGEKVGLTDSNRCFLTSGDHTLSAL